MLVNIKEIGSNTIIVGDITPHLQQWTEHPDKINRETVVLNDTIYQLNLIDIYRTLYPKSVEYTFKYTWNVLQEKSHTRRCHKTSFNKFKRTGDFPGGPAVKNPPCNTGDMGSIPGQETKIPHAAEQLTHTLQLLILSALEPVCYN